MYIDFLISNFEKNHNKTALIWKEKEYTYKSLLEAFQYWKHEIGNTYSLQGNVVVLEGDFSLNTISLLLALIENECIVVPLVNSNKNDKQKLIEAAQSEYIIKINDDDEVAIEKIQRIADNDLYAILRSRKHPGLVLFSSGTSGKPKGAVHDFTNLLEKFKTKRPTFRTLNFLLFDHWGGLNTMFNTLSNCGTIISTKDRATDKVCSLIEKFKIELLPVSPTFLNLIIISEAYHKYDLSSLKVISYGTEAMSSITLEKLNKIFPDVKFHQTYGLIEVGVLRTKSKDNGSLWLKLGGEGFQVRVVNNILQIKSKSAILGYLSYPSQFTDDGWFITGDTVETDGEYYKIIGRKSDIINIGGEKVYPTEVESVIKELTNVADVIVFGEKNSITGNIICANVSMIKSEDKVGFKSRLKKHCREKLQHYKVPVKINIVEKINISERFKKKSVDEH
ncbi:MAG: fatty acid--CoA ligase family protein [Bacteroidota bacterium]|nr:fatty acid--CoA ligase family protein [Bacteroidota bacterium]